MSEKTGLDFSVLENLDFDIPCEGRRCSHGLPATLIVKRVMGCCGYQETSLWCDKTLEEQYSFPVRRHEATGGCEMDYFAPGSIVSVERLKK